MEADLTRLDSQEKNRQNQRQIGSLKNQVKIASMGTGTGGVPDIEPPEVIDITDMDD